VSGVRRDFTLAAFRGLLQAALDAGYTFRTFADFARGAGPGERVAVIRHDVDRLPWNSVATARLERELGIDGTYYFRSVPASFDPAAVRAIAELGHEVGYHYEDLALARGNQARAVALFEANLARLRAICPVQTICMHGSPASRWDNREMWGPARADYRVYGLAAEPYLDVDFSRVGYLTDTGRRWDGAAVSVRDKVPTPLLPPLRTTAQVADAFRRGIVPAHVMITVHPQRWSDRFGGWVGELLMQSVKNQVKRALVRRAG
jgi:hypothetical protein